MTLYFPQLATGTAGQFPLAKTQRRRTVVNRFADGSEIRLGDPDAATKVWQLEYRGLSDAERATLADFFATARGRLRSFVFLDPSGNLLAHNDDLKSPVWDVDPLLRVEAMAGDGCVRLVNTSQTVQSVAQTVAVPGWFRYCGSGYFCADSAHPIRLGFASGGETIGSETRIGSGWTLASCSGEIATDAESIRFGIELPAGAVVDVRGLQLEAQPGRSGYRATGAQTGRYPDTRFDQDELVFRADGIDNHSTFLRLISRVRL